jgi:hypothetical protein
LLNRNGNAAYLSIYGITDPDTDHKYTVSGPANFIGVVYAPDFDFIISGDGDFSGALVGKTTTISGAAGFHYDEALSGGSSSQSSYQIVSWVEDGSLTNS